MPIRPGAAKSAVFSRRFGMPASGARFLGYWGHMWELYAMWTLTPLMVALALGRPGTDSPAVSVLSFGVIAAGGVGCVMGGRVTRRLRSAAIVCVV